MTKIVARMILIDMRPYNIVEGSGFREMVSKLN